jgi:hypothetical protein
MRRDPRVAVSVSDMANPYRMASIQGRVIDVRPDEGCRYMDPISIKYTSAPFPSRGPDRVCFVIAAEKARQHTLGFVHNAGHPVLTLAAAFRVDVSAPNTKRSRCDSGQGAPTSSRATSAAQPPTAATVCRGDQDRRGRVSSPSTAAALMSWPARLYRCRATLGIATS